jgi:hypothetical protein
MWQVERKRKKTPKILNLVQIGGGVGRRADPFVVDDAEGDGVEEGDDAGDDDNDEFEQVPDPQPGLGLGKIFRKYNTLGRTYKIRVDCFQRGGTYNEIIFHISDVFAELP